MKRAGSKESRRCGTLPTKADRCDGAVELSGFTGHVRQDRRMPEASFGTELQGFESLFYSAYSAYLRAKIKIRRADSNR